MCCGEGRVRPFGSGSQHLDWEASNCGRCRRQSACGIRAALHDAMWGDGSVQAEVGDLMGLPRAEGRYVWMCASVDWLDAWVAEWEWRQSRRFRALRLGVSAWRYAWAWARVPWDWSRLGWSLWGESSWDGRVGFGLAASIAWGLVRPQWRWARLRARNE